MATAVAFPWKKGLSQANKGWSSSVRHNIDFDDLKSRFMSRCARLGLTEPSQRIYRINLKTIFTYLSEERKRKYWQQVTQSDVEKFIEHYQSRDLSAASKHQVFRNLKTLLLWIASEFEDQGLACHIKAVPKLKRMPGRIYLPSPQELHRFIESFDQNTIWGFRDYVVANVILSCGCRIGEICKLTLDDIKWDVGMVRMLGKGNKERLIPIEGDEVFPLLKQWMLVRKKYQPKGSGSDRVFVTRNGGGCTPDMFDQTFRKHRMRTKLGSAENGSISPHTLRHFFCTYYLIDGGKLEQLQQIAGHGEIETTMNYVHLANQLSAIKDMHTLVSPLKSLKKRAGGDSTVKKRRMY